MIDTLLSPKRLCEALLGACILITGPGCGGGDAMKTVPVNGQVLLDGKPLADARVCFYPENGPVAQGMTNSLGEFELTTRPEAPGAVPGKHRITVEKFGEPESDDIYAERKHLIPSRYFSIHTSELTEDIGSSGKTNITLKLTSTDE